MCSLGSARTAARATTDGFGPCTGSYETIQKSAWPVATFLHNGYANLTYWKDFAAAHATEPPSMVMVDHPYPCVSWFILI